MTVSEGLPSGPYTVRLQDLSAGTAIAYAPFRLAQAGVCVCVRARAFRACVRASARAFACASVHVWVRGEQGWQGRGGSPTRAPRPATPGEISDPRPATPSDPGLPARPGHTRPGPDICKDRDFKIIFDSNISECLQL